MSEKEIKELIDIFSVSRPNGSKALETTRKKIVRWLDGRCKQQQFNLFPYYGELLAVWMIGTQSLLLWLVWTQRGWGALVVAVISIVVLLLELGGKYTFTRLIAQPGYNIISSFQPSERAQQMVVLSAHYDSKTDFLSPRQ